MKKKIQDRVMELHDSTMKKGFTPTKVFLGPKEIKELNSLERTPAGMLEPHTCYGLPVQAQLTAGITIEGEKKIRKKKTTKKFKEPKTRTKK